MLLDISEHRNIMIRILKDIYSDTTISPLLGFKGGTAAYIFYNLERFSVDLDFDLLEQNKKETVLSKIESILKNYGTIKEAHQKRFTLFFLLSYSEKLQNIKIEINCRNFGSQYEIKNYLGIPMLVMIKKDIFANKLVATYERFGKTNRDIYDIWFFLEKNWPINKEIVKSRTNMQFENFLQECISILEKKSSRNILSGVGELLNDKQKSWAKKHLLGETIFLLNLLLNKNKTSI